jgi:hypothetical protein
MYLQCNYSGVTVLYLNSHSPISVKLVYAYSACAVRVCLCSF